MILLLCYPQDEEERAEGLRNRKTIEFRVLAETLQLDRHGMNHPDWSLMIKKERGCDALAPWLTSAPFYPPTPTLPPRLSWEAE